jgi:hypothetical protein
MRPGSPDASTVARTSKAASGSTPTVGDPVPEDVATAAPLAEASVSAVTVKVGGVSIVAGPRRPAIGPGSGMSAQRGMKPRKGSTGCGVERVSKLTFRGSSGIRHAGSPARWTRCIPARCWSSKFISTGREM